MKICSICKEIKPISEYNKSNKAKDGVRSECKSCRKEYSNLYYSSNINIIKIKTKKYRLNNQTLIIEQRKKYKENNPEKIKESNKKYREENKNRIKEYMVLNAEKLRGKRRLYKLNRFKTNPLYKLKHNISTLIRVSFKAQNFSKKSRTQQILGCSYMVFKDHLESKFESWMNWANYGKYNGSVNYGWDIDHIIPLSTAVTEEDIIKLNHYTNLQPLCTKINRDVKRGVWRNNLSNKSS